MSQQVVRRLRPYLFHGFRRNVTRNMRTFAQATYFLQQEQKVREVTHDYEKRLAQLEGHRALAQCWPRLPLRGELSATGDVKLLCEELEAGEKNSVDAPVTVAGTVHNSSIQQREADASLQAESILSALPAPNSSSLISVAAMPPFKAYVSCLISPYHPPNSRAPPKSSGKVTGTH